MARFFVMCLFIAAWSDAASADASTEKFIDAEIDRLVALYSDGIAVGYPEYRHVKFAQLLGQGNDAAVALFSVEGFEGGNLHEEYLAVFEPVETADVDGKKTNPYRLLVARKIGERGWRTFDWDTVQIARGAITLNGKHGRPTIRAVVPPRQSRRRSASAMTRSWKPENNCPLKRSPCTERVHTQAASLPAGVH